MVVNYKAVLVDGKYLHIAAAGIDPAPGFKHKLERVTDDTFQLVTTKPLDVEYDTEKPWIPFIVFGYTNPSLRSIRIKDDNGGQRVLVTSASPSERKGDEVCNG